MRISGSVAVVLSVAIILIAGSLVSSLPEPESSKEVPRGVAEVSVPALDSDGNGVVGKFRVEAVPGDGKTLTNIDNLLYFIDTQSSIQTAKSVAANVTGVDISKYNIIYEIEAEDGSPRRLVEGPSAGAALAVATIAAIEGKQLSQEVMITGSINPDGTIGRVGGLEAKARAARDVGTKVLLVPQGQGLRQSFSVESGCERVGSIRLCRTEYKSEPAIANDERGLIIREVSDASEALKYFVQQ